MTELSLDRIQVLLPENSIFLDASATGRDDAVRQAGLALVSVGAAGSSYVEAMLDRERTISTYIGEGIAMPHGTIDAKKSVHRDALVLLRFSEGIDWSGEQVNVVIGVAAQGRGYIALISQLAGVLLDPARAAALAAATTTAEVYELFS